MAGIGTLAIKFTSTFSITGIAAGTLIVIIGYHGVKVFRRGAMIDEPAAAGRAHEGRTMISTVNIETPQGEVSPFSEDETSARGADMTDVQRGDAAAGVAAPRPAAAGRPADGGAEPGAAENRPR